MKLLSSLFVVTILLLASVAKAEEPSAAAMSGIVSGNVQMVGFRAMILRQAIAFNLAGHAKNLEDHTVEFVLQGDAKRIDAALKVIAQGTSKSSDVKVAPSEAKVDPGLTTFTVVAWTSTTRKITKPYDLIFTLRKDDSKVSEKAATKTYHQILLDTLDAEDLAKLGDNGD